VVSYGSVGEDVAPFYYVARATARGTFVVPPAFAAAMYDPSVKARSLAGAVVVK
jgi:hypothetical protein